jgi:hypothetical protein
MRRSRRGLKGFRIRVTKANAELELCSHPQDSGSGSVDAAGADVSRDCVEFIAVADDRSLAANLDGDWFM